MKLFARMRSWLKWIVQPRRLENEMEAEVRFHLESYAADLVRNGVPEQEAMRRARVEFGGIESHKHAVRTSLGLRAWDELLTDLRHTLRMMRRNPGFATVTVLLLALGIGANTAIFSLLYTLMLRRLPVRDPEQLVELLHRYPGEPHFNGFSWQAYQLLRDHNHVFSGLVAAAYQPFHVRGDGLEPQSVEGGFVDGNYFPVLGIKPALGRLIGPNDDRMGNPSAVAVLSWSCWKSKFNQDPAILGKQITVEGVPFMVVGVAPRPFSGLQVEASQDVWLPLAMEQAIHHPSYTSNASGWVYLVGRRKPGVSVEQVQAEVAVLYQSTLEEQAQATNNPFFRQMRLEVEPAGVGLSNLREEWAKPLLLLMAVVGLLLLIACSNLASMLLARGAAREHEMALRVSLGAGPFRLARQMLTESLLLSAFGSLLGVLMAYSCDGALVRIITSERRPGPPIELHVQIDVHVLLFTAVVALLAGLLFGLVPALRAMRIAPASSLRQKGSTGETRRRRLFGKSLVVVQVAMSVVLLIAAGVFIEHLRNLKDLDLGFQRDHVLLVTLDPEGSGYDGEQLSRAYQSLLGSLEAVAGVRSATICSVSPISGAGANRGVTVEGYQAKPGEIRNVMENWIGPKYFETLGTPLLAGRDFSFQDRGHRRVAIINQSMAHYYFGNRSPLARHITFDAADEPYEIVGIVGDAKYMEIREDTYRTVYFNVFQERDVPSQFALRTGIDPEALAPDVQRIMRDSLKTVSVGRVITLADQVNGTIVPERVIALLSGFFGALGSLLTAIGFYGLLAYTVARRVNEIGVRLALGASRNDMARMVLRDALGMVLVGLVIGAPVAFWCRTLAASLIPDLTITSALPIAFGVLAMIAIALVAAYVPARRATRVDPIDALRYE